MPKNQSISKTVYQKVASDETAYESMRRGFMNYSAYAETIRPEIEKELDQKTKLNTITAALVRFFDNIKDETPIKPSVPLKNISLKTPLVDITFPKNHFDNQILNKVENKFNLSSSFFAITQGNSQITIIADPDITEFIKSQINQEPIIEFKNLGAVVCPFDAKFYDHPNIIHSITSKLAIKKIEIKEIISTYTEIIYVVNNEDIDKVLKTLKPQLK